jgi:hypothetical protein
MLNEVLPENPKDTDTFALPLIVWPEDRFVNEIVGSGLKIVTEPADTGLCFPEASITVREKVCDPTVQFVASIFQEKFTDVPREDKFQHDPLLPYPPP